MKNKMKIQQNKWHKRKRGQKMSQVHLRKHR